MQLRNIIRLNLFNKIVSRLTPERRDEIILCSIACKRSQGRSPTFQMLMPGSPEAAYSLERREKEDMGTGSVHVARCLSGSSTAARRWCPTPVCTSNWCWREGGGYDSDNNTAGVHSIARGVGDSSAAGVLDRLMIKVHLRPQVKQKSLNA